DHAPASIRRTLDVVRQLDLGDGETKEDVTIVLWKVGAISGTVLDENGDPLVAAPVHLTAVSDIWIGRLSTPSDNGTTDDRGVFRFEVTPGDYIVSVGTSFTTMPSAFVDDYWQKQSSTNPPNFRTTVEALSSAGIQMPGQMGLHVGDLTVMPSSFGGGLPMWMAGEGGPLYVYPRTYYSSASLFDAATVVSVKSGEERAGIDFQLRPQATCRVSGRVIGPNGPVPNVGVHLTGADWNRTSSPVPPPLDAPRSVTDASGAFVFFGVVPGQYTVDVLTSPPIERQVSTLSVSSAAGGAGAIGDVSGPVAPPSMDPTLWAAQPLTVGSVNVADVRVTLSAGGRITGHFEFVPAAAVPPADRIRQILVTLRALPGTTSARLAVMTPGSAVDDAGAFRTAQIVPGQYILNASAPPGWFFRSAMVNGKDMADTPIDIDGSGLSDVVVTFTNQPTVVSGSVTVDETGVVAGAPPRALTVIVFPTDQNFWPKYAFSPRRLRTAGVSSTLAYRIAGLPAGEYFVAASASHIDFTDPKVLDFLSRTATRVMLVEGETRAQNVRAVAIPDVR
ncbi:MAG TPA: carboxypeptidase-like regulatory domain-containing protein, partial [Vicinamibacterales bacterium]